MFLPVHNSLNFVHVKHHSNVVAFDFLRTTPMKGTFLCFFESQAVKHDANGRSIRMKNSRANDFLDQKGALFNYCFQYP